MRVEGALRPGAAGTTCLGDIHSVLQGRLAAVDVQGSDLEGAPLGLGQVQGEVHVGVELDADVAALRTLQLGLVHALHTHHTNAVLL